MTYARGTYAFGYCDRCGERWDLKELKGEYVAGSPVNNRVCPDCWDDDHPQNFLHEVDASDPIALENPRPDPSLEASRRLYGFNPVSSLSATNQLTVTVGKVTVTTS